MENKNRDVYRCHLFVIMVVLIGIIISIACIRLPYKTFVVANETVYVKDYPYNINGLTIKYYLTGMVRILDEDGVELAIASIDDVTIRRR